MKRCLILPLRETDLSPRELAVRYTDEQSYFVSESTVYRLLKAQDLITSPAYILMKAGDKFQQPSRRGKRVRANGFYVLQDRRMGLVLLIDSPG